MCMSCLTTAAVPAYLLTRCSKSLALWRPCFGECSYFFLLLEWHDHISMHRQLVLHTPRWHALLPSHLFIYSEATFTFFFSPGEVVVFQCVEWLRGHLQERQLQQGSSEEVEKEKEHSAGILPTYEWTVWHTYPNGIF